MNFSPNCNRAVSEQRGIDCITFLAENHEAFIVMRTLQKSYTLMQSSHRQEPCVADLRGKNVDILH